MWPVIAATVLAVGLATLLGLMLGGYVPVPDWMLPVLRGVPL